MCSARHAGRHLILIPEKAYRLQSLCPLPGQCTFLLPLLRIIVQYDNSQIHGGHARRILIENQPETPRHCGRSKTEIMHQVWAAVTIQLQTAEICEQIRYVVRKQFSTTQYFNRPIGCRHNIIVKNEKHNEKIAITTINTNDYVNFDLGTTYYKKAVLSQR